MADLLAIQDLATAYAHAVDDRDWPRWEALFLPDAHIDYTSAGGIAGTPAELAAWMPDALSVFTFCLHTTSTHEIRFTGADTATGRVHVFNRNGVHWEGAPRSSTSAPSTTTPTGASATGWRFASRVEHTTYITGGAFADMIRDAATSSARDDRIPPFG